MKLVKALQYSFPLWIIVLLFSGINTGIGASAVGSVSNIPLEVNDPLEILDYPSGFSLFPGETAEFSLTLQNHASLNYSVRLDCRLNDTLYQTKYVTFSNEIYTINTGNQTITSWLKVSPDAPPANVMITISLTKVDEQNSETSSMSGLPASLELLGGGARWAAGNSGSVLFINWKDNWGAHHLTDGITWNPWPLESKMDNRRFSIAYALEQSGFNVDFAGDMPETLTNYDLVVINAYWAVEPHNASLIRDYIFDGGGVVLLGGVPCYFSVYCKDLWPYRAYESELDGVRFGLGPIHKWFGLDIT